MRYTKLALILICGLFLGNLFFNPSTKPVDENDSTPHIFDVEQGSSAKTIAKNLKALDLIKSKRALLNLLEAENLSEELQAGTFILRKNMNLNELAETLTQKGTGEMVLTIIEGQTIKEIDEILAQKNLIKSGDFIACTQNCSFEQDFIQDISSLEGFLFPDTYFINVSNFQVKNFINTLLDNFDKRFPAELRKEAAAQGKSLEEIVIVASLIEKEVRTEKDIPIVGGIIWKRLENAWPLGIDASSLYTDEDGILTAKDLANDDPYNTRNKTGLPPTPICNPGLKSLQGALNPEESPYWFYLTTLDTGEVIYSVTNEEHNLNKEKYL